MVMIWVDLDEKENRALEIYKATHGLSSKAKAVKRMIAEIR